MRKLLVLAGAAVVAIGTTGSANAWHHGYRHHGGWNNGGALVAGLVGGAVLGTLFSAATSPAWGWGGGHSYPATYAYGGHQGYYAAPVRSRVVYTTAAPSYAYYPQQTYPSYGYGYAQPVQTQVVYRSAPRTRYVYAQPRVRSQVVYAQPRVRVVSQQRVRRGDIVATGSVQRERMRMRRDEMRQSAD